DASIARELEEETGLGPAELKRRRGYIVTFAGALVSIAIEWQSALPADALRQPLLDHHHNCGRVRALREAPLHDAQTSHARRLHRTPVRWQSSCRRARCRCAR